MSRVLITGGAGFIGMNLAKKLVKQNYHVRVLDNLSAQVHGENARFPENITGVDFVYGDVRNKEDWMRALNDVDVVVHLAAETGTGQSMYDIYRYTDVNIGGTANLLDILVNEKHTVQKVLVASSRAIYGEGSYKCKHHGIVYPNTRNEKDMQSGDFNVKCPVCNENVEPIATAEDAELKPLSVYGITKQTQENLTLTVCRTLGIAAIAYRFQNVYGPGQSLSNPYTGILSIFSTRIKQDKSINIFEDGEESRDFVYIDDVVDALAAGVSLTKNVQIPINVGTGVLTSVKNVVNQLMLSYDHKVKVEITGNFRMGDIRCNFADTTRAMELLGVHARVEFQEGIDRFVKWVNDQNQLVDGYDKSLQELKLRKLLK